MRYEILRQVMGNTWVLEARELIPVYFLNEEHTEAILLDSGLAVPDREMLEDWIRETMVRIRAVICTHAHRDHCGNNRWLKETQGAEIFMNEIENCAGSFYPMFSRYYNNIPAKELENYLPELTVKADRCFTFADRQVEVEGNVFGLIPLPGHTPGHTGIVTPDGVCYAADAVMSEDVMRRAKLPSDDDWAEAENSRNKLAETDYPWYIAAHKEVYRVDEMKKVTEANHRDRLERIRVLLGLLEDGRSYTREEIIRLMWKQLDLHIHDGMKMLIFNRNLECLLQYLTDSGRLEREYSQGVAAFRKTGLFPG